MIVTKHHHLPWSVGNNNVPYAKLTLHGFITRLLVIHQQESRVCGRFISTGEAVDGMFPSVFQVERGTEVEQSDD